MPSIQETDQVNGATESVPKEARKSAHTIILDAGPILKNEPAISSLLASAENIVTVPCVIAEIRDANARSRIESTLLPFITLRNPKPESLKMVTEFARRTGDLAVLSKPDLLVLALAYELECERNGGDWRLRKVPGQKGLNGAPWAKSEMVPTIESSETEPAVANTNGSSSTTEQPTEDPAPEQELQAEAHDVIQGEQAADIQTSEHTSVLQDSVDELHAAEPGNLKTPDILSPHLCQIHISETAQETLQDPEYLTREVEPTEEVSESEGSDSEGWITPSNIQKHRDKDTNAFVQSAKKTIQVATITTDFAMQNVLLQMNLNLLSPSLQRILHMKTWVLRCHACFKITKDMTKQFCPSCGGATLMRTSCSTDQNGVFKIHLKKNYQWNNRGNVYSIPKPVPGSASGKLNVGGGGKGGGKGGWGQDLILREDQKEYVKAVQSEKKKKDRDLMDEDYLPSILTGERRTSGRQTVGAGRNVNSKRRK